jgi:uncharacterized membrane protein
MGLQLCNAHRSQISAAIMFYSPETCAGDGGSFEMQGWWNIEPGSCALVYANDVAGLNRFWYVFAHAADGAFWAGQFAASVPRARFDECWGAQVGGASSEFEQIGFREIDVGDANDLTLTFSG